MTIPTTGVVYVDTNPVIYSMEKHADYWGVLRPLWAAASARTLQLVASELLVLETLVGPRKAKNEALLSDYEQLFASPDIRICPVSSRVLRLASELRADTGIKTPDAIHAATALIERCAHFLTNDGGFGRVPKLPVVLLRECI
jgi:predicted nucleic acid-binding protein